MPLQVQLIGRMDYYRRQFMELARRYAASDEAAAVAAAQVMRVVGVRAKCAI